MHSRLGFESPVHNMSISVSVILILMPDPEMSASGLRALQTRLGKQNIWVEEVILG